MNIWESLELQQRTAETSLVHRAQFVVTLLLASPDYTEHTEPYNLAPQIGTFEVVKSGDPAHGQVLRQVVLYDPIEWCPINLVFPITLGGNGNW